MVCKCSHPKTLFRPPASPSIILSTSLLTIKPTPTSTLPTGPRVHIVSAGVSSRAIRESHSVERNCAILNSSVKVNHCVGIPRPTADAAVWASGIGVLETAGWVGGLVGLHVVGADDVTIGAFDGRVGWQW
jgi:hypothetical protein